MNIYIKLSSFLESKSDFTNWFGNSQVVDSLNNPLIVYHGTNKQFDKFDISKINSSEPSGDYIGCGFYFTSSKETAAKYGKNIKSCYLKINNPLIIHDKNDAQKLRDSFGGDIPYYTLKKTHHVKLKTN